MVITQSVRPGLSASGISLVLMIASTAWLATPARSSPPEAQRAKVKDADVAAVVSAGCRKSKENEPLRSATLQAGLQPLQALTLATGGLLPAVHNEDDDVEDRLARLEEALARLAGRMEKLTGLLDRGHDQPGIVWTAHKSG